MKNICKKIVGIFLALIIAFNINISFAVTQSEINSQKQQQAENNDKKEELESEKEKITEEKNEVQEEVNQLNSQIEDYQSQIASLESQISEANSKIEQAEAELAKNQEEYDKQQETLQQRMVAMYEAGDTSYLDFILNSESLTDFISNYYLVSEITEYDTELLEKLQSQKEAIETNKKQIEDSKQELTTAKANKESVTTQLQSTKSEKDAKVAELSSEEQEIQEEINSLIQYNAQISQEIKAAEEKYAAQLAALKAQQTSSSSGGSGSSSSSGGTSAYTGTGTFIKPVNSGSISAGWYYPSGSFHGAVDYSVPSGTPVYASAAGVVIKAVNLTYSYGTHVVIQHTNGMQTWYAHGSSLVVSAGQTVSQGQLIMYSGNSGHSTGAHLHFEMRVAPYNYTSNLVNPLNYL